MSNPQITIADGEGRSWSSILRPAELAALLAEAERISNAEREPVTPADVAAALLATATAELTPPNLMTCPGCGRRTGIVFNGSSCPACGERYYHGPPAED